MKTLMVLPVYITHTMNVFGERQHPEKFIPMCIKKIRDGETITIHSDKTKTIPGTRHYIHAEDVAEAIHFLLTKTLKLKLTLEEQSVQSLILLAQKKLIILNWHK